jgi:plastocyanin
MDTLESRSLRYIDSFAQQFRKSGTIHYNVTTTAGICLPIEKDQFVITIKPARESPNGDQREGNQHLVVVSRRGQALVADPAKLDIEQGDTVMWHSEDPATPGFVVRGEGDAGEFDSSALAGYAVYTHAFGLPGDYEWTDANRGAVSGLVRVQPVKSDDQEECQHWARQIGEGVLVTISGDDVSPRKVEILVGQTVFFAVEKAPGITITDKRLLSG